VPHKVINSPTAHNLGSFSSRNLSSLESSLDTRATYATATDGTEQALEPRRRHDGSGAAFMSNKKKEAMSRLAASTSNIQPQYDRAMSHLSKHGDQMTFQEFAEIFGPVLE